MAHVSGLPPPNTKHSHSISIYTLFSSLTKASKSPQNTPQIPKAHYSLKTWLGYIFPISILFSSSFFNELKQHMKIEQKMAESQPQFHDSLYCQEEDWEEESSACFNSTSDNNNSSDILNKNTPNLLILKNHDLFWEDHELSTMLSKEAENRLCRALMNDPSLAMARREAVDWMLKVNAHFSFSLQTAVLAVNYLDRFLLAFKFQTDKPWLAQLTAVACLSIAAKIEETYVPLLLDLQVEAKYLFEVKTIQRMEVLVLSTLEWKMNSVTPYSFLDYMIRRLGLKNHLCLEFLGRCKIVLLAIVPDSRFMCYLPSVVAASTMLHVINTVDPCIVEEYQNQISAFLGINKDTAEECGKLILELELGGKILLPSNKRKLIFVPGSPNGVIDLSFNSDNSNDSWSASSSPEPLAKKMRLNHPSVNSLSIPP